MVLLRLLGSQKGYDRSAWVVTVRFALQRLGVTTSSDGVKAGWDKQTKANGAAGRQGWTDSITTTVPVSLSKREHSHCALEGSGQS